MWTCITNSPDPDVTRYVINAEHSLSYKEVIELWIEVEEFRIFFNSLLKDSNYDAFFWEVKPTTRKDVSNVFEFVLVNSSSLNRISPEPDTFKKYFHRGRNVVAFPNLGGDAMLIVPTPVQSPDNYTHLAKFVRSSNTDQISDFWKEVGQQYNTILDDNPRWLSTAGLGVYWLHVRIDRSPKYFRHSPYKVP